MREIKFRYFSEGIMFEPFALDDNFDCHVGWMKDSVLMQYTGLKDKNGKEIYEGDIIRFKYYNVYKRWWSNLEEITIIEQECNEQRAKVMEQLATVVYSDGCYILKNGYPVTLVDVARGQRFERGQTSSCDTEEKQWDFEVIGNIYETPELL